MKIHMLLINLEGSISFDVTHWLTKIYLKHDILIKEIDIVKQLQDSSHFEISICIFCIICLLPACVSHIDDTTL